MTPTRAGATVLVLWLAAATGCALPAPKDAEQAPAQRAKTAAPSRPTPQGLTAVDALEHDLAVSEHRLVEQLRKVSYPLPADPLSEEPGEAGAPSATASSPAPAPAPVPVGPTVAPRRTTEPTAGTPCDMACRALGSMRRAADGICRLTGSASERCARARRRVANAQAQVRAAGCDCYER